jgi:hypothetical protein
LDVLEAGLKTEQLVERLGGREIGLGGPLEGSVVIFVQDVVL